MSPQVASRLTVNKMLNIVKISTWVANNRVRLSILFLVYFAVFSNITELPWIIIRQSGLYWSEPWITIVYLSVFFISSAVLMAIVWILAGAVPNVVSSLGYSKESSFQVNVEGAGHVIQLPPVNPINISDSAFPHVLSKEYDPENALSPLDNSRFRLLDHISKLRNNAVINLITGMTIASIGVAILWSALLQISNYIDATTHVLDSKTYALSVLIPRLSIALFVQVFSFFFLVMYRANQIDIKFFQNEITLVDSLAAGTVLSQQGASTQGVKLILNALAKNERNRVLKKGETEFGNSDEINFMKTLSLISQVSDLKKSLEKEGD